MRIVACSRTKNFVMISIRKYTVETLNLARRPYRICIMLVARDRLELIYTLKLC